MFRSEVLWTAGVDFPTVEPGSLLNREPLGGSSALLFVQELLLSSSDFEPRLFSRDRAEATKVSWRHPQLKEDCASGHPDFLQWAPKGRGCPKKTEHSSERRSWSEFLFSSIPVSLWSLSLRVIGRPHSSPNASFSRESMCFVQRCCCWAPLGTGWFAETRMVPENC